MSKNMKKVSIIIPVYNEEHTIKDIISQVAAAPVSGLEKEIVVVDDGSQDHSYDRLKEIEAQYGLIVKKLDRNQGKGMALREGFKAATGDIILIQDADMEYNPQEYPRLLAPIIEGQAQVVYGSRLLDNRKKNSNAGLSYYLGGRLVTALTNILFHTHLTDEPTCYKVFDRHVLNHVDLKCRGFEFCPEVTAKVLKQNIPIYEVPISYKPRNKEEGKKINWKDGLIALWTLLKYRFVN